MSNILKLILGPPAPAISLTAEVVIRTHPNRYTVKIGNREVEAYSAITGVLPRGTRVILNRDAGKTYIVGRETPGDKQTKRIVING